MSSLLADSVAKAPETRTVIFSAETYTSEVATKSDSGRLPKSLMS